MKKIIKRIVALVLGLILLVPYDAAAAQVSTGKKEKDYIVITSNKASYEKVKNQKSGKVKGNRLESEKLKKSNAMVVTMTEAEAISLENSDGVIAVEEDIIITANSVPEDSLNYDYEWNLKAIHATQEETDNSSENAGMVKIAVLDSGICVTDKLNVSQYINLVTEEDFVIPYDNDGTGHGTAVAGIIGAKNDGIGMVGVNPGADLYSVKIFDEFNMAPLSRVIAGVQWAIENNINIINMSFGTHVNSNALHLIIQEAYDAGILMVAAAGNNGSYVEYPAAFSEVIAVGATNTTGQRADFSAKGSELEIMAPGENILSTSFFDGYSAESGTSMAAPHVAGAAAVLWARDMSKPADFIRQLLIVSANKTVNQDNTEYGYGLLDVSYALEMYDEFERVYAPEGMNSYPLPENDAYVEELNDSGYVIGSWVAGDHETLVVNGATGTTLSAYHKMIMRKAVRIADDAAYSASTDYIAIHAGGMSGSLSGGSSKNYVLSLQFLYHAAYLLKNNASTDYVTLINKAASDVKAKTGSIVDTKLVEAAKNVAIDTFDFYDKQYNDSILYPQKTNIERAYKVLGFALHLAGDIFAHRTMVPMASVNSTVRQAVDTAITSNVYNLNHFNENSGRCIDAYIRETSFNKNSGVTMCEDRNWNCFFHGVGTLYVVEFCDIKWFTKTYTTIVNNVKKEISYGSAHYEDNPNFYNSRYTVASSYTTKYIIDKFISNADYLDNKVLLPGANGKSYSLKLNGLKDFYIAAGFSWDTSWDSYSVSLR